MTIGEKIYSYRKQAGLSQEDLAERMNVARQSISLWETDQTLPSLDRLIMLAGILGISLDELCGNRPAKSIDSNEPDVTECPPENPDCLAYVETKYTAKLLTDAGKLSAGYFALLSFIVVIASLFAVLYVALTNVDNAFLIIPFSVIAVFAALLVVLYLLIKKRSTEFMLLHPNCVAKVKLFRDYLDVNIKSDNSDSKFTVKYCDIKNVTNDVNYIFIVYGGTFVPIGKNLPDADYELILRLLKSASEHKKPRAAADADPRKKKPKIALLTMFILSLLSIGLAPAAVAICIQFTPLPEFAYTFLEYMWIILLFIPLPLASAVLGIVFYKKKFKCKKNIIAGFIMCVLLSVFGSFPFMAKNYTLHDFGYVKELEQAAVIDLPDSGYISHAKNIDKTVKSVAMIKFDDADEIYDLVRTDERFRFYLGTDDDSFNGLKVSIPTGYTYYWICDTTQVRPGVTFGPGRYKKCIFFGYNINKNILFVIEFLVEY